MTEPPALRLFLDRSTQGKRFVAAVRSMVEDVVTINDMYGNKPAESVADVQWIADATASGRILIGADRYILRNPLERHSICRNAARYVVFGANNTPVRLLIEMFERDLPHIRQLTSVPGPWVHRIARHGMERLALNCADYV